MIIDIHTHIWPDKVSLKAKESLESSYQVKILEDPTVSTLLRYMDKNKIDISVICAVATRPEQVAPINDWLFGIRAERIKIFAALHPEYNLWQEELKRIQDNADGIKFQPGFQNFFIDDEKAFPVYSKIQDLNIPVLFHCGEELSEKLRVRSNPKKVLNVRVQFPKLKMIAAHFGGFRQWKMVRECLLGKDIYFDLSAFFGYLPDAEAKEMILNHPANRLLFGSDFPFVDQKKDLDYLGRLGLSRELKDKILYSNARELLNL